MMKKRGWGAVLAGMLLAACGGTGPRLPVGLDHDELEVRAASGLDADDHHAFERRAPQPIADGHHGVWLAFSNHNHSNYWDGKQPLTFMQQQAYLHNIDAMALTDHNTMRGCSSHEFLMPPPGLVMVKGMEWNAFREKGEEVVGHAGLLGLDGEENIRTGAGLDAMLAEATRRNATVVINHPFNRGNSWTQPKPDARVHAIEVWNGWWYRVNPVMHNDKAVGWWDAALKEGRHLTALAGTDNHGNFYDSIDRVVTMVFAETPDQAGILAGIRAGRVSLTASTTSGRLYLEADGDGDGSYETMMGETVEIAGPVQVRARVLGGKGKQVVFYTAAGKVATKPVTSDAATIALTLDVQGYVRAELRQFPHLPMSMTAIANPIYANSKEKRSPKGL